MSIVCESSMNLYCSFEMEYLVGVLLCVVTFAAAGQQDTERGAITGDVGGQLEGQITGQLEGGGTDSRLFFSQSAGIDTTILADLAKNTDNDATSVSVPEGTTTTITTFTVSGTTGARDWTITNSLFQLTPVTGNNMLVVNLTVVAGATLDYETASTVTSNFTVTDNNNITGTIAMTLTLDDVNEAPVFNPASYVVAVADGSGEGTVAVTLTATDPEGTGVTYTLLSGNPGGDWSLDEATGVISVATRKAVDTATTPVYELAISATDGGDPSQTSSTTVTINGVLTFNQTDEAGTSDAPLRGNTAADVSAITVSEGTTATIVKFKIGGATGNTTWTSSNGDLRVIPESSDVVALTVAAGHTLDYEAGTTVTSTLTVVDSAATPATGIISLTLTLTDINDNAPAFTSTSIDAYITDGSAGSVVTTVTAIDADGTPENSNLVYAIRCYGTNVETGNERHRTYTCSDLKFETDYEVESYTGVIKVASGHTVNSIDQYELLIKATDTGVYPGQFTATTSVVINNVSSAPSVNAGVVFLQLMGAIFTIL